MLMSSKPTTPSAPSARATEPTGANSEGVDARLDKTESQLIARKVFQIEVAKPVRGDAAEKIFTTQKQRKYSRSSRHLFLARRNAQSR